MSMPVIVASTASRCQAITDYILASAQTQSAISHIINADGEGIQAVVTPVGATASEVNQVLETSKDLADSLVNLQIVLQSKLDLFRDCLCTCCETPLLDTSLTLVSGGDGDETIVKNSIYSYTFTFDDDTVYVLQFGTLPVLPVAAGSAPVPGVTFNPADNLIVVNGAPADGQKLLLAVGSCGTMEEVAINFVYTGD